MNRSRKGNILRIRKPISFVSLIRPVKKLERLVLVAWNQLTVGVILLLRKLSCWKLESWGRKGVVRRLDGSPGPRRGTPLGIPNFRLNSRLGRFEPFRITLRLMPCDAVTKLKQR